MEIRKAACLFYEKFGFKLISTHENEEQPDYLYRHDSHFIKVATFQGRIKEKNPQYSLQKIKENLNFVTKTLSIYFVCQNVIYKGILSIFQMRQKTQSIYLAINLKTYVTN